MAVWSETALSSVENSWGRFDAEYYMPEFLETQNLLSKIEGVKLRNSCSKIDVGHVGPMVSFYSDNGIILLQTQNVREFFLDLEHCIKITPDFHLSLSKSQVQKGDILIARSGSFGTAAIYLEDQIINSADIIIVQLNDPRIDPLFAVTFMNTKYGFNQLKRFASGGVQGHVNLRILENLFLPIFEYNIQKEISDNLQRAYNALKASAERYQNAQHLLESELGLDKLNFKKPVGYTARFSELERSRRADAEFFHTKYEPFMSTVKAYSGGWSALNLVTNRIFPNFNGKRESEYYEYIEISDINISDGDYISNRLPTKLLPANAKIIPNGGEILISQVRPTRGAIAIIDDTLSYPIVCSGAFYVCTVNDPNQREAVWLYLRSI